MQFHHILPLLKHPFTAKQKVNKEACAMPGHGLPLDSQKRKEKKKQKTKKRIKQLLTAFSIHLPVVPEHQ